MSEQTENREEAKILVARSMHPASRAGSSGVSSTRCAWDHNQPAKEWPSLPRLAAAATFAESRVAVQQSHTHSTPPGCFFHPASVMAVRLSRTLSLSLAPATTSRLTRWYRMKRLGAFSARASPSWWTSPVSWRCWVVILPLSSERQRRRRPNEQERFVRNRCCCWGELVLYNQAREFLFVAYFFMS